MSVSTINVTVNGERQFIAEGTTLLDLLEQLGEPYGAGVVELNRKFVHSDSLETTVLQDGDEVEVLLLAFGG